MSHSRIASTFDSWAKDGRGDGMEKGHGDVVGQVIPQLGIKAGDQVLDLGCGTGWATRLLAKAAPGAGAVGVDIAPEMIARAEELHSFTIRARYEVSAIEELGLKDETFSHVFSMEALYYAPDIDKALSEALRVLKPGGRIDVVIDFYANNAPTEGWSETIDAPMTWLSETEWASRFEAAGFTGVSTSRVVDSRGPGDEASFKPGRAYPDWEAWVAFRAAGSLWIHGEKPA
jgi:ubiquinone/menaquinone biosynthesis C-methylase UbiE